MKILFVADNRTRENWGCRATSIALKDIVKQNHNIIYTIYGDITGSYNPLLMHQKDTLLCKIYSSLYNRLSIVRKISKMLDTANIIRETTEKSLCLYRRAVRNIPIYQEIDKNIREADAVVVNGEGTFIFSTPERYDTIVYLLLLKVAQIYGKKTYCLNAMFSDSPTSEQNKIILDETKKILMNCTQVTARDPLSYAYCKKYITQSVEYVPDALFSWNQYLSYLNLIYDYPFSVLPFPEMENSWINYNSPYICLSGSSLAAKNQAEAKKAYKDLALALQKIGKVIIVSTCSGDAFLKDIAVETGMPYLPAHINIFAGLSLLSNAAVFVSGRWHPSILASIGGTPCVFLGSNSHKTMAIQNMLEYHNPKEYAAIPSQSEISSIVEDAVLLLSHGDVLRLKIKNKVKLLAEKAVVGYKI